MPSKKLIPLPPPPPPSISPILANQEKDYQDPVVHIPLWVGSVLRLFLFFNTNASAFLQQRVEASTPVTSWKRFQEGLYFFRHGIDPYDGGVYYQAPLFLPLFHYVPPLLVPIIFVTVDYAIARTLVEIAQYKREKQEYEHWPPATIASESKGTEDVDNVEDNVENESLSGEGSGAKPSKEPASKAQKRKGPVNSSKESASKVQEDDKLVAKLPAPESDSLVPPWLAEDSAIPQYGTYVEPKPTPPADPTLPTDVLLHPQDIGSLFLLNPFSIINCLAQSTLSFTLLAMVLGVFFSIKGKRNAAMLSIAVASYLGFYPVMMLAPVVIFLAEARKEPMRKVGKSAIVLFATYIAGLFGLSYLVTGSWKFLEATYGVILFVPDLTPNVGLYWYFFIEMFDQFRTFFLCVFQILAFVFVIPISTAFRDNPLFVTFVLTGIMSIFKSYPSVGDTAVFLSFLTLHRELYKYMRHSFLAFNALFYSTILGPLFYYLWIYAGSGNANFFYAITLVFGLAQVILLMDAAFAYRRREWDRCNPDFRKMRVEVIYK